MDEQLSDSLPWLPELTCLIEQALKRLTNGRSDRRPALEHELAQLTDNIKGWCESLAKSNLAATVRLALEAEMAAAFERKQEIEGQLSSQEFLDLQADRLVQPADVLDRLDHLADVLATNDPTRGNLELSLHIDRIDCSSSGSVVLRTCKLGTLPESAELFSTSASMPTVGRDAGIGPGKPRRRSRLRVTDDDDRSDEVREMVEFAADPHRFAGLGDEWFWMDELQIPDAVPSWAAEHAEAVFRRRQESKLSYAKLAVEFGKTPPTIGAAIRQYLQSHPDAKDSVALQRGGKRPKNFDLSKFGAEARQLWLEGWSKEKLATMYSCSPPTIDKAIEWAYAQEGLPMPTRQARKNFKVAEARRLLDQRKALDEIATNMKVSDVTARNYLQESFRLEGKQMPDLRSNRHHTH